VWTTKTIETARKLADSMLRRIRGMPTTEGRAKEESAISAVDTETISPTPAEVEKGPVEQPGPISVRDQIVRRFEVWIDQVLADEDPPDGLAAEILAELDATDRPAVNGKPSDLYSMWSSIAALTQEVKLQGRTFKQLHETISPMAEASDAVKSVLEANEEAIRAAQAIAEDARTIRAERDQQLVQAAREQARSDTINLLIDFRDRLIRGRQTARTHLQTAEKAQETNWLGKILGRSGRPGDGLIDATRALEKGYTLTLERLEEVLDQFGISEIDCHQRPFDPHLMTAVDIEEVPDVPEGTVLEIYRRGYERHGQVLRPAEVKVARKVAG